MTRVNDEPLVGSFSGIARCSPRRIDRRGVTLLGRSGRPRIDPV